MYVDEFKQYCRDKGKYNVTSLQEMLELYNEFDKRRQATERTVEAMPEAKEIDFSSILNGDESLDN